MKKKTKILLIVLGIIVALIVSFVIWQRNNIKAVIYFLKYSEEELVQMNIENKKELDNALKKIDMVAPRELTEEETKALENGEITLEEAIILTLTPIDEVNPVNSGIITGGEFLTGEQFLNIDKSQNESELTNKDKPINQGKPTNNISSNSEQPNLIPVAPQKQPTKLEKLVAELYVLKASYMSKLDGLEASGKKEYSSTPKNKRNATWKGQMISKYSGIISGWEAECDTKVEALIGKIREELKKTGGDMSVINTIRSTYNNEKQIKKAEYLNTYLK